MEKELARLKAKLAANAGGDLVGQARDIAGIKLLAAKVEGVEAGGLRNLLDQIRPRLGSGAVVLATVEGEKVSLVAGVSADLTKWLKAGELLNHVAQQVGGKGGGRPDMAQGGGTQPAALPQALASIDDFISTKASGR
jgi:alanyl-tRNA synthetase